MSEKNKQPIFKVNIFALLYVVVSLYGAAWISDEYNEERAYFYGYFALPFAVLFFSCLLTQGQWWQKNRVFYRFCLGVTFISFLWGNFLLLNVLTGNRPTIYGRLDNPTSPARALKVSYKKGGLGMLYRSRW